MTEARRAGRTRSEFAVNPLLVTTLPIRGGKVEAETVPPSIA